MAVNSAKKDSTIHIRSFPETLWNAEETVVGPDHNLFAIASVDEHVRQNPDNQFTGRLNLVILNLAIMENHRKRTLCCLEW